MTSPATDQPAPLPPGTGWRLVAAVLLGVFPAGAAFTLTSTVVALTLEREGVPAWVIGANAAMMPLATFIVGPFVPRIAVQLGSVAAIVVSQVLMAAALVAMAAFPSVEAWFVLRFVLGVGATIVWIITESWLNAGAEEEHRGVVLGAYGASIALGMAAGPIIVSLTGAEGYAPFIAAALIGIVVIGPVVALVRAAPAVEHHALHHTWRIFMVQPLAPMLGLTGGLCESAVYALFPVYGLTTGAGEAATLAALSAFFLGNVLLQIPLGWYLDRIGVRMAGGSLLFIVGIAPLFFALAATSGILPAVTFVWGGAVFSLYLVGLYIIGRQFRGASLVPANAAFVIAYQAGSLTGPVAVGGAMDALGAGAFPLAFLAVAAAAGLGMAVRRP